MAIQLCFSATRFESKWISRSVTRNWDVRYEVRSCSRVDHEIHKHRTQKKRSIAPSVAPHQFVERVLGVRSIGRELSSAFLEQRRQPHQRYGGKMMQFSRRVLLLLTQYRTNTSETHSLQLRWTVATPQGFIRPVKEDSRLRWLKNTKNVTAESEKSKHALFAVQRPTL